MNIWNIFWLVVELTNPSEKYAQVKMEIIFGPRFEVKIKTYLKPPNRKMLIWLNGNKIRGFPLLNHHLGAQVV